MAISLAAGDVAVCSIKGRTALPKVTQQSVADILSVHACQLLGPGVKARPTPFPDNPELTELMALAEQVQAALPPVRPPPAFVKSLGRELREMGAVSNVEVLPPQTSSWVVGAAALGSVLSLLGLFHLVRETRHVLRKAS